MSWTLRLLTPALLLGLACTPKDDESDAEAGDSTSAGEGTVGGSTTSGDVVTTGDSDPTMPGTASATATTSPGTSMSGGTDPATTTSPGTSVGTFTEGGEEATSNTTLPGTTDDPTDTDPGTTDPSGDPPAACDGDAVQIVANTIVAYTEAQIPPQPDPTNTGSTGGEPNPPDTIYVRLSDQDFLCKDPTAILECGPHWQVTIVIKPEFQFPGVYDLLDTDMVFGHSFETAAPDGMGECGGGGGSFGATFELIQITDTTVEGRLCNVQDFFFDNDPELNGSFVAERCP